MSEQFWDLYARWYDSIAVLEPYIQLHKRVIKSLGELPAHTRILDAGCGTGNLLFKMIERFPQAEITGVDRSGAMLRRAKRKLSELRAREGVGYQAVLFELDLNQDLPGWEDASFDAIVSVNVLYALEDPEAFLKECNRLLAPGGQLILANPWRAEQSRVWRTHFNDLLFFGSLQKWVQTSLRLPSFGAALATNVLITRAAKERAFHFLQSEELYALAERVGLCPQTLDSDAYAGTCCFLAAGT